MSGTMTSPLTEGRQGPPTDSTIAIVAPGSTRRRPGGAVKRRRGPVLLHVVLIVAAISMVFPFIWMLLTSLKTLPQLLQNPLEFLPNPWTVSNYTEAWNAASWWRWIRATSRPISSSAGCVPRPLT